MMPVNVLLQPDAAERARDSRGTSGESIYQMVAGACEAIVNDRATLLDVGCGSGALWRAVGHRFERYLAADIMRYEGLPAAAEFRQVDLDNGRVDLSDGVADVVAALETIEHLENPRAFMRELVRLAKPSGWILVTSPNQLSLLSKLTLVFGNQFNAFQERPGLYPAHLTALLEIDLLRIAAECGLVDARIIYSGRGRIPFTSLHYHSSLSRRFRRALSDNVLLIARKTGG